MVPGSTSYADYIVGQAVASSAPRRKPTALGNAGARAASETASLQAEEQLSRAQQGTTEDRDSPPNPAPKPGAKHSSIIVSPRQVREGKERGPKHPFGGRCPYHVVWLLPLPLDLPACSPEPLPSSPPSPERKPHPEVCLQRALGIWRDRSGLRAGPEHLCPLPEVCGSAGGSLLFCFPVLRRAESSRVVGWPGSGSPRRLTAQGQTHPGLACGSEQHL